MQTPAPHPQQAEVQSGTGTERQPRHLRAEKRRRLPRPALQTAALTEAKPRIYRSGPRGSGWSGSGRKRCFDLVASAAVLLLLAPVFLFIVLLVRLSSRGPAIFRQKRVGRHGEAFTILKFRTMHCEGGFGREPGHLRSAHKDHRLTPPGRWLRKYKLDELPQLLNVIRGDMSLVGPRPKLHAHHTMDTPFRPGITGAATLAFAAEEHLLRNVHHDDLESTHARLISPRKIQLDLAYMARATFATDFDLILKTLLRSGRYMELEELTGEAVHARTRHTAVAADAPPPPTYPELIHPPAQTRGFKSVPL